MTITFVVAGLLTIAVTVGVRSAKNNQSVQNLRQIGLASQLYANDHNDYLSPWFTGAEFDPNLVQTPEQRKLNHPAAKWKLSIISYNLSDDQFFAPLDPQARSIDPIIPNLFTDKLITSYRHSLIEFIKHSPDKNFTTNLSFSSINSLSEKEHMLEAAPMDERISSVSGIQPFNGTSVNILYFDGHVSGWIPQK